MYLWHLNNMKVILTFWTLNYVDCTPFLFSFFIISILFTIEPTFLKKSYSPISKKHDQTSSNLNNSFDFIGWFSKYVAFDEIEWLCAFTKKYTTQNFITATVWIDELILTPFSPY